MLVYKYIDMWSLLWINYVSLSKSSASTASKIFPQHNICSTKVLTEVGKFCSKSWQRMYHLLQLPKATCIVVLTVQSLSLNNGSHCFLL